MNENNQELIDQKFNQIMNKPTIKTGKPPAKFPELRYLWGITLLGSFALLMLASVVQVFIGG